MNLSLYSVNAFIIMDSDGHRVLAKYYRSKSHPRGEPKDLVTLKEQKAFEKGLWQKTKKSGGLHPVQLCDAAKLNAYTSRRHHSVRLAFGRIQTLARPYIIFHRWTDRKRANVVFWTTRLDRRVAATFTKPAGETSCT